MQKVTSAEAQNRFGRLLDMAQREPVAITRHGRTAGYVIGPADMEILLTARDQRDRALRDWEEYVRSLEASRTSDVPEMTPEEISREIKAARAERRAHEQQRKQA